MEIVVHHWDADGVSSAAILMRERGRMPVFTPPVGEFKFDPRIESGVYSSKLAYFVDLNMPGDVFRLAERGLLRKAYFIDHHIQEPISHDRIIYHNPLSRGEVYPSASFVVSELFNHSSYLTVLGAVGDVGERLFEMERFGELAEKILEEEGVGVEEVLEAVRLVDSNYITLDRYGVEEAALFLSEAELDDVLERVEWIEKAKEVKEDIERAVNSARVNGGVAFVCFYSPNAIISKVARELVWSGKASVCVAVNRGFNGKYQLYVRLNRGDKRCRELIESLRKLGINAGGKEEVVGSVFEADEERLERALEEVRRIFGFEVELAE